MNNRSKSTFCIVNSNKVCVSTQLVNLIYDKVERNQVLRIETIKQELCKLEKKESQIKIDDKQWKNSYETLLIQDINEGELKPGHMHMEKWSTLSDVAKYVQYNQYPIGHYELEVKA